MSEPNVPPAGGRNADFGGHVRNLLAAGIEVIATVDNPLTDGISENGTHIAGRWNVFHGGTPGELNAPRKCEAISPRVKPRQR